MKLKLIVASVKEEHTDEALQAAREAGATGYTVISRVRGEGLTPARTFFGLDVQAMCDVLLFVVAEPRARAILEAVAGAARFEDKAGSGIIFQTDVEDAIGFSTQFEAIADEVEESL